MFIKEMRLAKSSDGEARIAEHCTAEQVLSLIARDAQQQTSGTSPRR